jgi:hypothetical protein
MAFAGNPHRKVFQCFGTPQHTFTMHMAFEMFAKTFKALIKAAYPLQT